MTYAQLGDVEQQFPRPLEPWERQRAENLLIVASSLVERNVSIGEDKLELAAIVVADMVAEALLPGENRGMQSFSWRNGGLAGSGTRVDSAGIVSLRDWHLALLGGMGASSPRYVFGDSELRWPP